MSETEHYWNQTKVHKLYAAASSALFDLHKHLQDEGDEFW